MQSRSHLKIIILCLVSVVLLLVILWFVFSVFSESGTRTDSGWERQIQNPTEDSNLTNWGLACELDGSVYYSDFEIGIYKKGLTRDRLLVDGVYTDLCAVGKYLCCVELPQTDDEDAAKPVRMIRIDPESGEKAVLFEAPAGVTYLQVLHTGDYSLYFSMNDEDLYTVNLSGRSQGTGIFRALNVTSSGIYAPYVYKSGLQLLDFDGEVLQRFPTLDHYSVTVLFELGTTLYLTLSSEDNPGEPLYAAFDMANGVLQPLPCLTEFGRLKALSYWNGNFYVLCFDGEQCHLCLLYPDTAELSVLASVDAAESILQLLSIVNGNAFLSFPFSPCKSLFILLS